MLIYFFDMFLRTIPLSMCIYYTYTVNIFLVGCSSWSYDPRVPENDEVLWLLNFKYQTMISYNYHQLLYLCTSNLLLNQITLGQWQIGWSTLQLQLAIWSFFWEFFWSIVILLSDPKQGSAWPGNLSEQGLRGTAGWYRPWRSHGCHGGSSLESRFS